MSGWNGGIGERVHVLHSATLGSTPGIQRPQGLMPEHSVPNSWGEGEKNNVTLVQHQLLKTPPFALGPTSYTAIPALLLIITMKQ